ncbi:MAG: hypothetical protein KDD70_17085, partial [Bdellovibrionales bacterium]|nr:hypothetical protein [Bdellovibrionales bacterium]
MTKPGSTSWITPMMTPTWTSSWFSPLTPVLATGSAASAVLGSPLDAVLVGSVLLLNAALSAAQRLRAERLLKRLLAV